MNKPPRSHYVSFLILMPRESYDVGVFAKTEMRNTETGELLHSRDRAEQDEALLGVLEKNQLSRSVGCAENLLHAAQQNNWGCFVKKLPPTFPRKEQLWVDLLSLRLGSQSSTTSFSVPRIKEVEIPKKQKVILIDDQTKTVATISGGSHLRRDTIEAFLKIEQGAGFVRMDPKKLTIDAEQNLVLEFESFKKTGFSEDQVKAVVIQVRGDGTSQVEHPVHYGLIKKEKEKKVPGFDMQVTAQSIFAGEEAESKLHVHIRFEKDKKKQRLTPHAVVSLIGATIKGVTSDPAGISTPSADKKEWKVTDPGVLIIELADLDPNHKVIINGKNKAGVTHKAIERPVREKPKKDQP